MRSKDREKTYFIIPRIIRIKDAPTNLGIDKICFNREVHFSLIEIPISTKGIKFYCLDLDA